MRFATGPPGHERMEEAPLPPESPVTAIKDTAMAIFGFAACDLEMEGMAVRTDRDVTMAQQSYAVSEAARQSDGSSGSWVRRPEVAVESVAAESATTECVGGRRRTV